MSDLGFQFRLFSWERQSSLGEQVNDGDTTGPGNISGKRVAPGSTSLLEVIKVY